MKIRNPNYKSKGEKRIEFLSAAIDSFLAGIPEDIEFLSFDEIRTQVESLGLVDADGALIVGEDLADGIIDLIAQKRGVEVASE